MESKNNKPDKYYVGVFYYDNTSKRIFVYDRNANRYTLNFANKWAYVIMALLLIFLVLGIVVRIKKIP